MQITNQMIHAAVIKAMELGVLPRKSLADDIAINSEIMVEILQAAVNAKLSAERKPLSEGRHEP